MFRSDLNRLTDQITAILAEGRALHENAARLSPAELEQIAARIEARLEVMLMMLDVTPEDLRKSIQRTSESASSKKPGV